MAQIAKALSELHRSTDNSAQREAVALAAKIVRRTARTLASESHKGGPKFNARISDEHEIEAVFIFLKDYAAGEYGCDADGKKFSETRVTRAAGAGSNVWTDIKLVADAVLVMIRVVEAFAIGPRIRPILQKLERKAHHIAKTWQEQHDRLQDKIESAAVAAAKRRADAEAAKAKKLAATEAQVRADASVIARLFQLATEIADPSERAAVRTFLDEPCYGRFEDVIARRGQSLRAISTSLSTEDLLRQIIGRLKDVVERLYDRLDQMHMTYSAVHADNPVACETHWAHPGIIDVFNYSAFAHFLYKFILANRRCFERLQNPLFDRELEQKLVALDSIRERVRAPYNKSRTFDHEFVAQQQVQKRGEETAEFAGKAIGVGLFALLLVGMVSCIVNYSDQGPTYATGTNASSGSETEAWRQLLKDSGGDRNEALKRLGEAAGELYDRCSANPNRPGCREHGLGQ